MAERITGHTELIGLMAYPIRHSSSPAMHNEAFAYLGLDYAYLAFEVDNSTLEDAIKGLRALKMVGSNVSMPNKTVVGQYLDELSPAAEMCGAVNTIVNDNGKLIGHITDGIGFMQALKDNDIDVIGKKMTICGAGGAATAIEIQAALDGVKEISIFNIHDKFWDNAVETVKKINEKTECKATLYDLDDKEKLKEKINNEINNLNSDTINIELPIINKKADGINLKKIHDEIYKQAQDAYITQNPLTVHPNVNGVDFAISIEEAEELLKEEKEEYIIPLKITVAEKTVSDLGEDAFPNTLGNFTTRYDASNKNRSNNIYLASEKINGTIIMPGETFSYNQVVGKRTIDAGYKEAGAYAGGKVIQEIGGGICQVSSTLYNAVLYADLEIVERSNHYFETSYVTTGRDATVSWGTVDFKFKNNRTYPIKIEAVAKNGINKISILGIKEEKEYEIVIQSKVTSIIEQEIKYENDYSIPYGEEEVEQQGHNGCTSKTYIIKKLNGATVSTEEITSDYYHALDKIIKKGMKR